MPRSATMLCYEALLQAVTVTPETEDKCEEKLSWLVSYLLSSCLRNLPATLPFGFPGKRIDGMLRIPTITFRHYLFILLQ